MIDPPCPCRRSPSTEIAGQVVCFACNRRRMSEAARVSAAFSASVCYALTSAENGAASSGTGRDNRAVSARIQQRHPVRRTLGQVVDLLVATLPAGVSPSSSSSSSGSGSRRPASPVAALAPWPSSRLAPRSAPIS
jgi:hypothetical protein